MQQRAVIEVEVSEKEKNIIELFSRELQVTISDYVRALVLPSSFNCLDEKVNWRS
jgi:hypothetical protein